MVVPGSVTLLADLSDQPLVSSVELTVGTGPGVCVGPGVGVGPVGVLVRVGVAVAGLAAYTPPPPLTTIAKSKVTAKVRLKKVFLNMFVSFNLVSIL
jgi:hypothetical protein